MLLDKLDGVGADRQVKWRLSLRCAHRRPRAPIRARQKAGLGRFRPSFEICHGQRAFGPDGDD
jgi:hypothetical protein